MTSFVYSNLFSLAKTVTIRCDIQTKAYAHSQARARWRAQPLKITIHQLLHYCRLRQCYSVPFRLVIYRSFSSDFDGFSYLPCGGVYHGDAMLRQITESILYNSKCTERAHINYYHAQDLVNPDK